MVPPAIVVLPALPLSANGKIDRAALPAPEASPSAGALVEHVPPRTALERFLAQGFRDVLALPPDRPVGLHDDFFALGGHSITGAIFINRLQETLSETVHVVTLFNHPTVASLAAYVTERHPRALQRSAAPVRPGHDDVLVPLQSGSLEVRPLFCVHPVGGDVACYRELARRLGPDQPVYGLRSPQRPQEPLTDLRQMAALYVEAARQVQPSGPYRLAGWSMGGLVAYEMARQLVEQGEPVELVALIDAASPQWWAEQPRPSDAELAAWFARDLARLFGAVEVPAVRLDAPDVEGNLARVLEVGHRAGVVPESVGLSDLRRLFDIFRANRLALSSYPALPCSGSLELIRATEPVPEAGEDRYRGWRDLAAGGVTVHDLQGDHYSIVLGEGVERLAASLRDAFMSVTK
jgi:thioesterase domain-containing protein